MDEVWVDLTVPFVLGDRPPIHIQLASTAQLSRMARLTDADGAVVEMSLLIRQRRRLIKQREQQIIMSHKG